MKKNLLFLALILSVTATDLLPANHKAEHALNAHQQATDDEATESICVICFDSADDQTPLLTESEAQAMLTCKHHDFHQTCLQEWLTPEHNTCPICRAPGKIAPLVLDALVAANALAVAANDLANALANEVARRHDPLYEAAARGDTTTVQALLETPDINVNRTTINGNTALHYAAGNSHIETVQALLTAGALVNAADAYGNTALHGAAGNGNTEIVQALLAAGAMVNAATANGNTALHTAAQFCRTPTVQALLAAGAIVNAANADGDTALHIAAQIHIAVQNSHTRTVQALLAAGANTTIRNNNGHTAADLAYTKKGFRRLLRSPFTNFIFDVAPTIIVTAGLAAGAWMTATTYSFTS